MRVVRRILFFVVVLMVAVQVQAQEGSCDLTDLDSYEIALLEAYETADYETVINLINCVLEIDPEDATSYYTRGNAYYYLGEYDSAIADFDLAIELDPQFSSAYLNRGWAYISKGDPVPHQDFFLWVLLTETEAMYLDLFEAMGAGNLPIEEGYSYRFTFEGTSGQVFGAAALSADATDPLLILLDGNGEAVISDDDGGVNLNSVIRRFTLPDNGVYTLLLSQAGGYGTGEIEVAIYLDGEVQSTNPDNANIAESFAVYNLFIDETAEVFTTGGDRLNVREFPGVDNEVVTQVPAGELVTLLAGPIKEDGYRWWEIRTVNGEEGWAVERVVGEQTLQLALIQGEEAIVSSSPDLLNVRDGAGRDFNVIAQLEDGAIISLLDEAPVIRDSFRWWHIRTADGTEGWVVDRIATERVIVPAREFPNR